MIFFLEELYLVRAEEGMVVYYSRCGLRAGLAVVDLFVVNYFISIFNYNQRMQRRQPAIQTTTNMQSNFSGRKDHFRSDYNFN